MTEFIHLPLKVTSHVDWKEPLSSFLTTTFGRSFVNDLAPSIDNFNKSRIDLENPKITDKSLLVKYWKYYSNLSSLDMRLPISAVIAFTKEDTIGMHFTWNDVFDSSNEKTNKSISFEKASILFNIAALHSYLGATYATEFNWKLSIDHFSKSSGILSFISDKFHHCPTNDLKVDTVKGLAKLMFAQALEGFLWNYLQFQTNVKHSLAARLAEGTSTNLRQCDEYLSHGSHGKDMNFTNDLEIKADYLHAFAQVHHAENYYEIDQIGNAIASLKIAKETIEFAKRQIGSKGLSDAVLSRLLKELEAEVKQKISSWDKDNDLIYHHTIPEKSGIPTIKPMEGVKVVSFDSQIKSIDFDDMFEKIIPMDAHEGLSIYSEKQADLLREWSENVQVANEQIISTFEFLNLPNSVKEVQNLIKPAEEEEMEQETDYPRVLAMAHDVEKEPTDFKLELQKISTTRSTLLNQTEKAQSLLAQDHQNVIRGLPNSPDIQRMGDEVNKISKILNDAGMSDAKLKSMFDSYERDIGILKGGTVSVQKWLDENDQSSSVSQITQYVNLLDLDIGSTNSDTNEIKNAQMLIDTVSDEKRGLDTLIKERNNTLNDMKNLMHSEDISTLLLQNKGATQKEMETLFEGELSKYKTYTERLSGLIEKQEMDILELKDSLRKLLSLSLIGRKVEERKREQSTVQAKISSLVRAYDTWKVSTKGIKEAGAFYNSLGMKSSGLIFRLENAVNERSNSVNYPSQNNYQF